MQTTDPLPNVMPWYQGFLQTCVPEGGACFRLLIFP